MSTSTFDRLDTTDVLLVALRAIVVEGGALPGPTALPVGDHGLVFDPARTEAQVTDGRYGIVWEIPGGAVDTDDMGGRHDQVDLVWQVDSYGVARPDAAWVMDRMRRQLLGRSGAAGGFTVPLVGAGWSANTMREVDGGPGSVEREADDLYVGRERYVLRISRT